ncbi:MAG TPA: CPBP family intramembrane glutamic endopeptidase, partial [Chitinophagaceae bacterium]
MQYKSAKGFTGWGQLAILIAFLGAGLVLAVIVQFAIGSLLIGPNVPTAQMGEAMAAAFLKPQNATYIQVSQILGTFFLMFLPAFLYMRICHGKNKLWLGFSKHINFWQIVLGICLIFCANIVANPVADLSKAVIAHFPNLNHKAQSLEDLYSNTVEAISGLKTWGQFFLALVIMAFFPALFEEMLFRGALQNLFVHWWKKPVLAIIFTSLLFSVVHTSIYFFLSRAILGFALGWMYYRSKNLWVNIMAHFL